MGSKTISINRAPVLTLWVAVVGERLGFSDNEALSLGKAVASLTAQRKGRKLGIYEPHKKGVKPAREKKRDEEFWIEICGCPVPAKNTDHGIRAVSSAQVIEPDRAPRYLEGKFGDDLSLVRSATQRLAKSFDPKQLGSAAFRLYERFRPEVPEGVKGWGAKGN